MAHAVGGEVFSRLPRLAIDEEGEAKGEVRSLICFKATDYRDIINIRDTTSDAKGHWQVDLKRLIIVE